MVDLNLIMNIDVTQSLNRDCMFIHFNEKFFAPHQIRLICETLTEVTVVGWTFVGPISAETDGISLRVSLLSHSRVEVEFK